MIMNPYPVYEKLCTDYSIQKEESRHKRLILSNVVYDGANFVAEPIKATTDANITRHD